jgi:hypothetical protein
MRMGGVVDRVSSGLRVVNSQAETLSAAPLDSAPCASCARGPVGRYCASCGQRRLTDDDLTARAFLHDTFHELTSLDGRLWHTLVTLLAHPGKLARDYFDGRGGRYMKPLSLFVLTNLVFFLVQPHTGLMQYHLEGYLAGHPDRVEVVDAKRIGRALELEADREKRGYARRPAQVESRELFSAHFEDALQDMKKSMLIVGIPVIALALGLLYVGQHRRAAEHLVFSSHFWAFFLVFMTLVTPVFMGVAWVARVVSAPMLFRRFLSTEPALMLAMFLGLGTYLFLALRRMYGSSRLGAALRATALSAAVEVFLFVFASRLFDVTLWSL